MPTPFSDRAGPLVAPAAAASEAALQAQPGALRLGVGEATGGASPFATPHLPTSHRYTGNLLPPMAGCMQNPAEQ